MGLKKGMTNNRNGRPKGAINKTTADLRKKITNFLNDEWETVLDDWRSMEPKDRTRFYEKMLLFRIPHLQRTEYSNNLDIDKLSDKELDLIIAKLKKDFEYEQV